MLLMFFTFLVELAIHLRVVVFIHWLLPIHEIMYDFSGKMFSFVQLGYITLSQLLSSTWLTFAGVVITVEFLISWQVFFLWDPSRLSSNSGG